MSDIYSVVAAFGKPFIQLCNIIKLIENYELIFF